MKKDMKRELIDESSQLSSSRWSLITCIEWGIFLAVMTIILFVVCHIIGKPLSYEFITGCTVLVSLIIGIPMAGKTGQTFSELKNHYFDKYDVKNKDKNEIYENDEKFYENKDGK